MSSIDVASNTALLSVAEKLDKQNIILSAIARNGGGTVAENYAAVQSIVRMGLAPEVFAIGDQFVFNHDTYGEITADVIGFDINTPSNKALTHSMTLQFHDSLIYMAFDAAEALFYAESELAAGTYYFSLPAGYDESYGGGKTIQFTLTNPVPVGGQIAFSWGISQQSTDAQIKTYANQTTMTATETVSVVEGSGGTDLSAIGEINNIQRVRFGSNNYNESAIRQFLNSKTAAGSVWTPQNKFDRPPAWAATTAGLLNGMDKEFLAVIGKVDVTVALNTLTDGGGSVICSDKFFLLSRNEVYGGMEGDAVEGTVYPYYKDYSDLSAPATTADMNRIKYRSSGAADWRLRSATLSSAFVTRTVNQTGGIGTLHAFFDAGIAPACCII